MTASIDALTVHNLGAALDAAVIRQQVYASNIANAGTPGYQAQEARFVASSGGDTWGKQGSTEVELAPRWSLSGDGAVKLDREMAAMAQNGAHYQALLRALNRHLSVLMSAASDGRRG